jgi:glycosyltransferase involved in cell wall biosynthesis
MTRVCILSSVHLALDNRVFYREACSLQRAGYDVTLIAVHPHDEVRDGVRIVALPRVPRWQRPLLWLRLARLALAARAGIYHLHDPELLLVVPWLRLLSGRPAIYDIHESYPEFIQVKEYLPGWVRGAVAGAFRWLEPALARLQSALIFSDDQIAATFERVRRPKATLYNFPERAFIEAAQQATQGGGEREPAVLYLGGMERNRGSRLVAEAFELVRREVPAARLRLVGHFEPAALEQELRADAARRGFAEALDITGRVPFEQIGGYLCRSAVGWVPWQAVPKNQKNVPTKLFEYMAYGLPVVAGDLPSTRPFIQDGENGFLVAAGDPAAHAQAIVRLLRDPLAASAMGRAGQARVAAEWNWDAVEQRLLALYEALLHSSR